MKKISYIIAFLICVCSFTTLFNEQPAGAFPDTRGHWAQSHIDLLESRQLISGYPDGLYHPGDPVSRQELVSLIIRILGRSEDAIQLQKGEASYHDTSEVWGKGDIELARELNIAHGDGRNYFHPTAQVTREEAVTIIVNSLETDDRTGPEVLFSDEDEISPWALNSINTALEIGLIRGYPDNSFRPRQNVTRAEVSVLLENLLEIKGQKFHFFGQILKFDLPAREAKVLINGKTETFALSNTIQAYHKTSHQPVTELKLPAKAYINVNSSGQLAYLSLVDQLPDQNVSLDLISLPPITSAPGTPGSLVPLEEEVTAAAHKIEYSNAEIARSLYSTREAMGVNEFSEKYNITGRGQLIAVIDSGIDAGHADLQKTSEGFPKIIDIVDLTEQGKVQLKEAAKNQGDYLAIDGRKIDVAGIPNNAKKYRYGYLKLPSLPVDFDSAGQSASVLVIVTAGKYSEHFDTIYIDTDRDFQVSDEIAIKKYSQLQQFAAINGINNRKLNVVVSEISNEGNYIKLSFDSLGHGTQVAGIAAANGIIKGVAPGAQVLAIKVLNNMGSASLNNLEKAVRTAAERGCKVAVLSMGQYNLSVGDQKQMAALAEEMLVDNGLIICMAGGNQGPGIETVASTAAIKNVISVGAYATPAMWKNDYGWSVAEPTMWYFSSSGPASNGNMAPAVIAPGSVISTYPLWGGQNYRLTEGTSIAAPHVAGLATLLNSALSKELYRYDTQSVYHAILEGAERVAAFSIAEQGMGAVNILNSWQLLQEGEKEIIPYATRQYSPDYGYTNSLYSRYLQPAELWLTVFNNSDKNYKMAAGGLSEWINPEQYTIQLPAHGYRNIEISYDQIEEPGLYGDLILLDEVDTPGYDIAVLQTLVLPVPLHQQENHTYAVENQLPAGQLQRYYFYVPADADKLSFNLEVGDKGRARMHVISPGQDTQTSSYAGVGEVQVQESVAFECSQPQPGTWEVVVYSSASLSEYKLKTTDYRLTGVMEGWEEPASQSPSNKYLVTAITENIEKGQASVVTLNFWDPVTKQPAEGVVAIEDRLYEIHNGMVQIPVVPDAEKIHLTIAW